MTSIGPVIAELAAALDASGIRFVVGGSFASGAWGNPRQTNDIDIAIELRPNQSDLLAQALGSDWIVSVNEMLETLDDTGEFRSFQLIHIPSVFKVDVFVPFPGDFTRSTFSRAQFVSLLGVLLPCLSAEDIVIQKLRWYELGHRVSDRQWNDIVQVIEVRKESLELDYLRTWASEFGLRDLLEDALSQAR